MLRTSLRRRTRASASKRRDLTAGQHPVQLPLLLIIPTERSRPNAAPEMPKRSSATSRFAGMDARMSTTDVVRVVGVNRSTLFRWCKRGTFPQKHISGGWLRSDVERWFATKAEQGA